MQPYSRDPAYDSHILVVEDEERSRRLLHDLLDAQGYRVTEAVDGEEALRLVNENPPDLILLDVMMPKLDGFEVCRRLQADERTQPVPVLLVTALHERDDRLRGIEAGATDFLTKPVDAEEVLLRVRNALRTKHLYDQRSTLLSMREELSDMIVHDIRNPLLSITLCAHRLQKELKPETVLRLAEDILGQTRLLDDFVSDLLTVSRMEQGHLDVRRTTEGLVDCIRNVIKNHQPVADSKNIRLNLVAPEGPVLATVDGNLFARLVGNLLGNAIKFSPKNTSVTVTIKSAVGSGTPCLIQVEDEGPGIPLGYRETIFEKYGVVKMKNLGLPQTGLGLTFCRMAAEAHGGRIYVKARQPCGSIFTVELP